MTRLGIPVRQLRDSRTWQKLVMKERKRAVGSKQAQNLESEDEEEDKFEEDEQYDKNQNDNRDKVQSNVTLLICGQPS